MEVGDIGAAHLARAFDSTKSQQFEDLLGELLRHEKKLRHSGLSVVDGPAKGNVSDGGRDLFFDVRDPPRVSAREFSGQRLTWDDVSKTYYSCKTGHTWAESLRRDLKTTQSARDKGKPPSRGVLEHMSAGGRYVVVTSEQTSKSESLKTQTVEALQFWLEDSELEVPDNLSDRVEFLDANDLAQFLREHKPPLSRELKDILDLASADGFKNVDEWTLELEGNDRRDLPAFEPDAVRKQLQGLIGGSAVENRIIHVIGAPGVGKTRAVYEALVSKRPHGAIRYSKGVDDALRAFKGEWLRQAGALSIVIDEVRVSDVEELASYFASRADEHAQLIMVGVPDLPRSGGGGPVKQIRLPPLERAATRRLVETAFEVPSGTDDPRIESVLHLAEDYPLFAVLLSRALAKDGDSLERGDDESSRWEAATRVLAGPKRNYATPQAWQREAELRGKCLLVVLLTGHLELEWSKLWELHGAKLAQALHEKGHETELERAERACRERELLRYAGASRTRRYVSPNNLARILLNHFLRPGPEGPDLGPRLLKHTPDFRAELYKVAQRVNAAAHVCERLARSEWQMLLDIAHQQGPEGADSWLRNDEAALEATYRLPEVAAETIYDTIRVLGPGALETRRGLCDTFRAVLQAALHRKMTAARFAKLEDALFVLATLEGDSPWSNNAKAVWESLFLVAASGTHQPWMSRLRLLERRARGSDPLCRLFACHALHGAVGHTEQGLGYSERDRIDGEWELPTPEQYTQAKQQAWRLLIEVCEDDDLRVAEAARTTLAEQIRGGVLPGRGLEAEDVGTLDVSSWGLESRRVLRDALSDIWRYDEEKLDGPVVQALRALQRRLEPDSFEERLQAQVGTAFPGPLPIDQSDREEQMAENDRALARELVASPSLLATHLPWFWGPDAVRSHDFLHRLAEVDSDRAALPLLEAGRPASDRALASYLVGWVSSSDGDAAEQWLRSHAPMKGYDAVLAHALPALPVSDERIEWLTSIIEKGAASPNTFRTLGHLDLASRVSEDRLCRFIEAAAASPELAWIAVAQADRLLAKSSAPPPGHFASALVALRAAARTDLSATGDLYWERLFARLVESLHLEETLQVAASMAEDMFETHNIQLAEKAFELLIGKGLADRMWDDFAASVVTSKARFAARRTRFVERVTPSLVLDWVGNDEQRAVLVAAVCSVHRPVLGDVVRGLLSRFGAQGRVGRELAARFFTTPRATHSMTAFYERQRANATEWMKDSVAEVRAWAAAVAEDMEQRLSDEATRQEFRRRYA